MRSFSADIRWTGDDGQTARVASRWAIRRGTGINTWTVADNLGRASRNYSFEAGARKDLANWLRAEAAKLEEDV